MKEKWIDTKEALKLCKKYDLSITKAGLYFVGRREKFMKGENEKHYSHILFEKNKLLNYIKEAIKPVPNEWISIKEAGDLRHITVGYIYQLITDKKIECRVLGRKRINHVLKKEIMEYGKE